MTELATLEPPAPPALPATSSAIQAAAQDMASAHFLAKALCSTSFAPAHFKGKPEEGAAAIMYGSTINMDPLTALQNIFMISGRPGLYARAMVAIVLSHGHEMWTEEDTPEKVTVCGRRKGLAQVERSEWTIARARKAGYLNNKKYETDPQAMLYARAAGDVARKVAPDALLGMAYSVEELQLLPAEDEPAVVSARSGSARLAAAVGIEAAPEPATHPDGEPTDDEIAAMNAEANAAAPDDSPAGGLFAPEPQSDVA